MTSGDLLERLQTLLGSNYRLEKELGGGGMSRVFVAEETALGRKVVVKVLPPEFAAGLSVDRFRREIQVAAGLHHPHIVPLLSAGQAGDVLYYTMPLIDGESLRARIARHGELPVPDTVRLLRDVVDGLAFAHERGLVHRDIKPDNVLISGKHALVTDFGVAKALESSGKSSLTSTGLALGTPAYMAPEQAAADPHTDHRADLYAIGVLAYEMLTGTPPFTGPNAQSVLTAHVTKAPLPVNEARATVPPGLASLVMRCLEKKPADRYQNAEDLLTQLELLATPSGGTQPTSATPAVTPAGTAPATAAVSAAGSSRLIRNALLAAAITGAVVLAFLSFRKRTGLATGAASGQTTIAVLPLENLGRPEDDYFVDGLTDEIASRLTGVQRLRVIARSSANQYKKTTKPPAQIGQELGAEYLLQGTVRWEKQADGTSEVRVNPALIKASDATNAWAHSYDAKLAGIFQVQSQIATEVANALDLALGENERTALAEQPTQNAEAFDYYLRGQSLSQRSITEEDNSAAIQMYQHAVDLDPDFVQARAALSIGHGRMYWFRYDHTAARLRMVQTEAERALHDGPEVAEAHMAVGLYYYWGFLDYPKALAEMDLAEARKPSDSDVLFFKGAVLRRKGDWHGGLDYIQRAVTVDPRSTSKLLDLAATLEVFGRYDDALRVIQRAQLVNPDSPGPILYEGFHRLVQDGDTAAAETAFRRLSSLPKADAVAASGGFGNAFLVVNSPAVRDLAFAASRESFGQTTYRFLMVRAEAYDQYGESVPARAYADSARAILERSLRTEDDDWNVHQFLARAYVILGRRDDAIREVNRAAELLPISKDAVSGPNVTWTAAVVHARTGDSAGALDRLEETLKVPAMWTSANLLRISPYFAPLKGDPRFQRLLSQPRPVPQ